MANYWYETVTALNGVKLHAIKTSPNNTTLTIINKNITNTSYFGINGGFFFNQDILSMAVINNKPLKGNPGDYGSGWYNHNSQGGTIQRGTIIWDPVTREYKLRRLKTAADIQNLNLVQDLNNYWARGGVSMTLQDDANWYSIAQSEELPDLSTGRPRTGLVYNTGLNIWYIVTFSNATGKQFREAIKEKIGSGTLVDGIFLDGGGSTQIKCAEYANSGGGRSVVEIVRLINK
ncbi:MAG: hypothetical protein KGZ94_02645 [Clostridia bacterium]|nr:hypothetical protein [Clostridia bacterium]